MSNIIRTYCQASYRFMCCDGSGKTLSLSLRVSACLCVSVCVRRTVTVRLCNSNQIAKRTFHSAQQFLFLWRPIPPRPPLLEKFPLRSERTRHVSLSLNLKRLEDAEAKEAGEHGRAC